MNPPAIKAKGAELAGTGICSGEGGMLPDEQAANTRYFYELASARFVFSWDKLQNVQAFHFKGGQGAKTGTGGHLPGEKVQGKIAAVRELEPGTPAISPARFPEWTELGQFRDFAEEVRERTGGIPVGFKLSAQHIEKDIDAAIQAIGCIGMRACHSNNCPVGIATQKPQLRGRLPVDIAAERLARFFGASVELMTVLARAAGHDHLGRFNRDDLTTFKPEMAKLTGIAFGGVSMP